MPVSLQQILVVVPFSLVSVLGVGLIAQDYDPASPDLLASPQQALRAGDIVSSSRLRELMAPSAPRPAIQGFTPPPAGLPPLLAKPESARPGARAGCAPTGAPAPQ